MNYNKETAIRIYKALIKEGMTNAGAYGMMANIYAESCFVSNNAQNSGNKRLGLTDAEYTAQIDNGTRNFIDSIGYGLCQWTSSGRKKGLLDFAKSLGKSVGDESMQIAWLIQELKTSYKKVWSLLTTSNDISECAKYVMTKFERPADQSETAQNKRASYGVQLYKDLEDTKEETKMGSNSPLVNYTKLSPNCTKPRKNKITKIVIHHMAGNLTVETCGNVFQPTSRQASANYGIGTDGRVGLYVEECNRAWTSGNATVDNQAITIEVANDVVGGNWHVSDKALAKTIELCADICKRNGIEKLTFTGDKNGNLVAHRYYQATQCPGEYLYSKFPYIADEVNKLLGVTTSTTTTSTPSTSTRSYLMKGDKGAEVKTLQENLNYIGYSCAADGDFGAKTDTALRKFQKAYKLTVDGKYGASSKKALEDAVAKKKNTTSTTTTTTTTTTTNSSLNYDLVFNATYYANKYPDLKAAFGTNKTKLLDHFKKHGIAEGRQAISNFNVVAYKTKNPDLQKAFGNAGYEKYVEHYLTYGYKEKRTVL